MPVYEYECPKCLRKVEITMSVKNFETSSGPKCVEQGCDGSIEMRQILSPAGIRFKGSGWTPKFHR